LIIHADNSRCHTAKVVVEFLSGKKARFAPHPPYSPDLAPSDFFLFGYLKCELRGCFFSSVEELLGDVKRLLADIPAEMFVSGFHEWISRCERVITGEGDYFE
jgi:transposase